MLGLAGLHAIAQIQGVAMVVGVIIHTSAEATQASVAEVKLATPAVVLATSPGTVCKAESATAAAEW